MSETTPHRILHLIIEDFSPSRAMELAASSPEKSDVIEIFQLTEASAREALEKIFAADTIAVWGPL
jgi:hypothetical protein